MPDRIEDLKSQIDILNSNIRLGWVDMDARPMTPEQRRELRASIHDLMDQLPGLVRRLDALANER
jgi:hypothetical protein